MRAQIGTQSTKTSSTASTASAAAATASQPQQGVIASRVCMCVSSTNTHTRTSDLCVAYDCGLWNGFVLVSGSAIAGQYEIPYELATMRRRLRRRPNATGAAAHTAPTPTPTTAAAAVAAALGQVDFTNQTGAKHRAPSLHKHTHARTCTCTRVLRRSFQIRPTPKKKGRSVQASDLTFVVPCARSLVRFHNITPAHVRRFPCKKKPE